MDITNRISCASEEQVRKALNNIMLGLVEPGVGTNGPNLCSDALASIGDLVSNTLTRCLAPNSAPASTPDCSDPASLSPGWSAAHAAAAMQEGWNLFECFGSEYGRWQVQRLDDATDIGGAPKLTNDAAAWDAVLSGTGNHHAAAQTFVEAHSAMHYAELLAHKAAAAVPAPPEQAVPGVNARQIEHWDSPRYGGKNQAQAAQTFTAEIVDHREISGQLMVSIADNNAATDDILSVAFEVATIPGSSAPAATLMLYDGDECIARFVYCMSGHLIVPMRPGVHVEPTRLAGDQPAWRLRS